MLAVVVLPAVCGRLLKEEEEEEEATTLRRLARSGCWWEDTMLLLLLLLPLPAVCGRLRDLSKVDAAMLSNSFLMACRLATSLALFCVDDAGMLVDGRRDRRLLNSFRMD